MNRYTSRHAAEKSTREGCSPGGDIVKLAAGLTAIVAAAIGATVVGVSIDDNHSKANTNIQQPEERKPDESADTPSQSAGLDVFVNRSPEENTIVDSGSYVTSCSLRQQRGLVGKGVICVRPNLLIRPGARPADESSINVLPVSVDSRKQPTSA